MKLSCPTAGYRTNTREHFHTGIFTPVPKDNLVLVDGGIVNPVPVDVAGKMGANAIIAIDLNHGRSGAERGQDVEAPKVFQVLKG